MRKKTFMQKCKEIIHVGLHQNSENTHFGQFSNDTLLFMRIETRPNQGKLQNR